MKKPICKFCQKEALYCFSPYPNNRIQYSHDPLFKFHIGIKCISCDKWCGWVNQTPELIEYLRGAVLIPLDRIHATSRVERTGEIG